MDWCTDLPRLGLWRIPQMEEQTLKDVNVETLFKAHIETICQAFEVGLSPLEALSSN